MSYGAKMLVSNSIKCAYLLMKKILIAASLILLPAILFGGYMVTFAQSASWHMINVNHTRDQGDANLLINGNTITMIDAGYQSRAREAVIPYLKKLGIKRIHHFFISHPHRDHYEGMEAIQNAGININHVYYSMPPEDVRDCCYNKSHFLRYINAAKKRGAKLHNISKGFKLRFINGSKIEVLHAHKTSSVDGVNADANDMSLIMKWHINKYAVLFTGDLNKPVGKYLSDDPRMSSHILKMPHHGGYGIAPNSFFERVNPQLNMVPGPKWVWDGERGAQSRKWTEKHKIPHCVNGINGNVKVNISNKITISSQRPDNNCKNGNLTMNPQRTLSTSDASSIMPIIMMLLED